MYLYLFYHRRPKLKKKSSAWNGQAATNQTPNPSQYVLVSFHLISRAIRPLQPTPSGSLFSKIQDKTTPGIPGGHPELECEALSFLLQLKLGVKGNRLNRNGSEK